MVVRVPLAKERLDLSLILKGECCQADRNGQAKVLSM